MKTVFIEKNFRQLPVLCSFEVMDDNYNLKIVNDI